MRSPADRANPSFSATLNMADSVACLAIGARTIVNVATRVEVGAEEIVVPGLTVLGTGKKLLIRAVGPKLADQDVEIPLPDPKLQVFQSRFDGSPPDLLVEVDDWTEEGSDVEGINAAIDAVGAFPLEQVDLFQGRPYLTEDTKGAAIVMTLDIGAYTVRQLCRWRGRRGAHRGL